MISNSVKNPFVGLRPFESEDSLYFFGRDEQTHTLLKLLHETHFLAVVGSSGSGKSSLVRAGLIPHLEAGFLVQDRDVWYIARMKPGDQPIANLAQSLLTALKQPATQEGITQFSQSLREEGVHAALERILPVLEMNNSNLLLLVDQFEEIFRFSINTSDHDKKEEAIEFVSTLLRLTAQPDTSIYICLTMRSDYLGDCDFFQGLPEALNRSQYLVPRLTRWQRQEAIEGPLHLAGATISTQLLNRLLNESTDYRDDLPVLQHALMLTWNEWSKNSMGDIEIAQYEKIGTIYHALSQNADETFHELTDDAQHMAKRLFQILSEIDFSNRQIRRPTHLKEIAAIAETSSEKILNVIEQFQKDDRNFLTLSSPDSTENPLVDISHESLIRQWGRLADWVNEEAESAKIYRRLAESSVLYRKGKAGLYRDADLELGLQWRTAQEPNKEWAKRYHPDFEVAMQFLESSKAMAEYELSEREKQRQEREQLLQEKANLMEKQNQQQQRTIRQTRIFSFVLAIALTIALILGYQAIKQSQKAQKQTLTANYNLVKMFEEKMLHLLDVARENHSTTDFQDAWLYGKTTFRQDIPPESTALHPASIGKLFSVDVIHTALSGKWFSPPMILHQNLANCLAFTADRQILASVADDQSVRLWDVVSGHELRKIERHSSDVKAIALSPNGQMLASGSSDFSIRLCDVATDQVRNVMIGHTGIIWSLAFSPDGRTLASGSADQTIRLWDVAIGQVRRVLKGQTDDVKSLVFSPDGQILVSGSDDQTIRVSSVTTGLTRNILKGHTGAILSMAFNPDGKTLASGSEDHTVRLWDIATGHVKSTLTGHKGKIWNVTFNFDGQILASGSSDQTIRLWDVATGHVQKEITDLTSDIFCVAFNPDGKSLLSVSEDQTIRLWQVKNEHEKNVLAGHTNSVYCVAFNPDGQMLASGAADQTIRLWDLTNATEMLTLTGHAGSIWSVAFSPDGQTMASASSDQTVRLWNLKTGDEHKVLKGHTNNVHCVVFSPDGQILASGSSDQRIRLWEVRTGREKNILKRHTGTIRTLAISPDGKILASGSEDQTIRLWDVATGYERRVLNGHKGSVWSVAFSPDGQMLVTSASDRTIRLWNVVNGHQIHTFEGHTGDFITVGFCPDGMTLASGSSDQTIRLWDIVTGRQLYTLTDHTGSIYGIAFSPDGRWLASGAFDQTIRLWDLSVYQIFLEQGKPKPLYFTFTEGAIFFWGLEQQGPNLIHRRKATGYQADVYYFEYDPKFRPLLDPPAPGKTKFDQILEWAREQEKKK